MSIDREPARARMTYQSPIYRCNPLKIRHLRAENASLHGFNNPGWSAHDRKAGTSGAKARGQREIGVGNGWRNTGTLGSGWCERGEHGGGRLQEAGRFGRGGGRVICDGCSRRTDHVG